MITQILKQIWNKKASNALMLLEILLTFLVLFFAIAYTISQWNKVNRPLGFDHEQRYMLKMSHEIFNQDSAFKAQMVENLKEDLLNYDGVESVSFLQHVAPFQNNNSSSSSDDMGFEMNSKIMFVDTDYASTMNVTPTRGRWFNEDDLLDKSNPVIVNQKFIDEYFPEKDMLDSILLFSGERRLVGIVDEIRYLGEFSEVEPTLYVVQPQTDNYHHVLIKMKDRLQAKDEPKLASIIAQSTGFSSSTLVNLEETKRERSRNNWIMLIAILSICGFLCVNVALGLFGVMSYNISKRKAEIGLRQALGAHTTDITKQFIIEALILAGFAVVVGVFFAVQIPLLKVTEYPDGIFYQSIIYSSLIILGLVLICALLPSIQAATITPANSLHED